jgi:oligoendopeptidase F
MTATETADTVHWNLADLLETPPEGAKRSVDDLLEEAHRRAEAFAGRYRGALAALDSAGLAEAMSELGAIYDLAGRAGSFAQLEFSIDTADPHLGAQLARMQERWTALSTLLLFFELEWAALDDERVEALLAGDGLDFCRHHLRSARRYRPHLLSEPEERILSEKSISANSAWGRLYDELTSAIEVTLEEPVPLDVALSRLASPSREVRRETAAAVTRALVPGLRTRAFVFNTLLADKTTDDRLRSYGSWIADRNLANEASDESVAALVEAVVGRYEIARRWYRLKAKLLGIERLADWDRMAPLSSDDEEIEWPAARELVLDSFGAFSPTMRAVAQRFFEERWIDAPTGATKRGGAFCDYTVPSVHPYVLLNWTGRRRDALVLAHELGHGIHAALAAQQGIFQQSTPLTLAETASVFGEALTFGRLLEITEEPAARLALLAEDIEGAIATVFRQVAMNRFEDLVHTARREDGELSVERFGELWARTQEALLGDAVEVTPDYRMWWSYIPHFIHTPGYVYAYAYGQLLAMSVYERYETEGRSFEPSYIELLSSGGSRGPEELGAIVGVDLADPGFWDRGLDLIERRLDAAEALASDR